MIKLDITTSRTVEFIDVTAKIQEAVTRSGSKDGVCLAFVPHTTAGIIINENADPSVAHDIVKAFDAVAPENAPYRHAEGNSPAHIKASVTGASQAIVVEDGRLRLGRWQGVFFCEFDGPRRRELWVKVLGGT